MEIELENRKQRLSELRKAREAGEAAAANENSVSKRSATDLVEEPADKFGER